MIKRCYEFDQIATFGATFNADRALSRRWQTLLGRDQQRDTVGKSKPLESRGGKDDPCILPVVELAKPGLHIAAQRFDLELRKACAQLTFAAQARSTNDTAYWQLCEIFILIGNQCIARVFTLKNRRN